MKREAVILAGGFGTRLKSVLGDLPKPMAPVGREPFLAHLLRYVSSQGFCHVVLSVGFKHETVTEYFGDTFEGLRLSYEVEQTPLGTGGALLAASRHIDSDCYAVFNGDTMFEVDMGAMFSAHEREKANVTIAVKSLERFDRYGTVSIGADRRIAGFSEKRFVEKGFINGGVYVMDRDALGRAGQEGIFSLERDFFERCVGSCNMFAFPSRGYFLDIGIPDDYDRAQLEVPLVGLAIDKGWTLFLDRDGVINRNIDGDYVRDWQQFEFLSGATEALTVLSRLFGRVIVVTNQQGVGKRLYASEDVDEIHRRLKAVVAAAGGQIDAFYYCPHLASESCDCRKPRTGMIMQAATDFPGVDLGRSILVGDSPHDTECALRAGIRAVAVGPRTWNDPLPTARFHDLRMFADVLVQTSLRAGGPS